MIETHISYVLLAGEFAYKLKKPVKLPFLDYSTLEARQRCCAEELRINRRTAPTLYLGVENVGGDPASPRIGRVEPLVDVAVKMRRFPQEALLDAMAREGTLRAEQVDALAEVVARLHENAARSPAPREAISAARFATPALANFDEIRRAGVDSALERRLLALVAWTAAEADAVCGWVQERAGAGFERECHGDLHLGNVVLVDGRPVAFDAIEFSAGLRWIDVACDAAFTAMDLHRHGLPRFAARFLDRYLSLTGDYGALPVLRYFMVYRAMVRAKVAALALAQAVASSPRAVARREELRTCVELAERLSRSGRSLVVAMHGLPASGKTTVSARLLEALGAVRVRSDVERKRLAGLASEARAGAPPGEGIYGAPQTAASYDRLEEVARSALAGGFPVIVDATFARREQRERFRELARARGASFHLVSCTAPKAKLRERIARRARLGGDASDAGTAVLEARIRTDDPLGEDENAITVDTAAPEADAVVASLAERLAAPWR